MVAVAVVMTVGAPMVGGFDGGIILIGVVLAILFNDWSSWWLHRGRRALAAGRIQQAITDLTRAIGGSPEDPLRYYCRATALLENEDYTGAREDVARSAQLAPDSALPCTLRGWINVADGLNEEARADFCQAIALDPMDAGAEIGSAFVDFRQGDCAEAIRRVEKCLELHPHNTQAACLLAWFLSTCRDDRHRNGVRAVAIAERACRMQERRFFWGELSLAGAYAETGRFAEAIERAEHAALLAGNSKRNDVSRHLESLASGQAIRSGGLATKQDEASEHGS